MRSKEDLVGLLNNAKIIIYGDGAIPFELKQLTWYSNPKINSARYSTFIIKKKSGGDRIIHAPGKGLIALQKAMGFILQCMFDPHDAAMGFVRNKSIVQNARIHSNSNYVYNIDLKDFFSSIEQARFWRCLQLPPFNLVDKNNENIANADNKEQHVKRRQQLANIIAALCCTEMSVERKIGNEWVNINRNVLPQGAPTSPVITNIICQRLDYLLSGVANRFGLKYSRYADDLTFSSIHNVYQHGSDFQKELQRIIAEQGFFLNEKKTRLQKKGYRQEVTGLLVNENVNVQKRYIKELRKWLYYWETYGYEKANLIFLENYYSDSRNATKNKSNLANVLGGKLEYLAMVKGTENQLWQALRKRFLLLAGNNPAMVTQERRKTLFDDFSNNKKKSGTLPHSPRQTTSFLINFKRDNDTGLKELVHIPNEEHIDIDALINKVTNHPNLSKQFSNGYKPGFEPINIDVQQNTIALVKAFIEQGRPFWQKHKVHPYGSEHSYTRKVNLFKSNYRIGPVKDGYTNFRQLIESHAEKVINNFPFIIMYEPDVTRFDLIANFYTWVPSLSKGINYIIRSINDHSNEFLNHQSDTAKYIKVSAQKDRDNEMIHIDILDAGSKALRTAEEILKDLQKSEPVTQKYFYSICNWTVFIDTDLGSFSLNVLNDHAIVGESGISKLKKPVNGFMHRLSFYNL